MDQPGSCPGRQRTRGAKTFTGIIVNVVLVLSGFHTRKSFSENYTQVGHTRQPCRRPKNLKNIGFKGRQIINLPGGAHMSRAGPGLSIHVRYMSYQYVHTSQNAVARGVETKESLRCLRSGSIVGARVIDERMYVRMYIGGMIIDGRRLPQCHFVSQTGA